MRPLLREEFPRRELFDVGGWCDSRPSEAPWRELLPGRGAGGEASFFRYLSRPFFSSALSFCVPRNPSSPSALLYCFDFLSLRITMDCSRGLARMQMGLLPGMAGGAEEKGGTGWRRRGRGGRRTRRCDVERMRG